MAGLLSFSRQDAVALPLTRRNVDNVIARTRAANLVQLGLSVALVAGLLWVAGSVTGRVAWLFYATAAVAAWAIPATGLSTWDHFRTAATLRKRAQADLSGENDPKAFWWAHRGVFPHFSR